MPYNVILLDRFVLRVGKMYQAEVPIEIYNIFVSFQTRQIILLKPSFNHKYSFYIFLMRKIINKCKCRAYFVCKNYMISTYEIYFQEERNKT